MVMEAYLNFGFIGSLVFFLLIGWVFRGLYEWFLRRPGMIQAVTLFVSTGAMMLWIRNSLDVAIRPPVWGFMAVVVLHLLFRVRSARSQEAVELPYESGA